MRNRGSDQRESGDFTRQKPDLPEPTPEEKAEHDRIRKELEPIREQYGALIQKISGPSRVRSGAEYTKVMEELSEVGRRMSELNAQLPREYDTHGWVWLFLRKR